jgi:hypothetical protein
MALGCTGVKEMVIVNNIDEINRINVHGLGVNSNRYAKIHHLIERALISMISFNYKSKENGLGSNI